MDFTPFLTRTDYLAIWVEDYQRPEPFEVDAPGADYTLQDLLEAHVAGEERFGVYTPDDDGNTRWACIDIDGGSHRRGVVSPDAEKQRITGELDAAGIKWHEERSNSGEGWHIWVFYSEPVPAKDVRGQLLEFTGPEIELFPKRDTAPDKIGNMVWLPWWGRSRHCELEPSNIQSNPPPPEFTVQARPRRQTTKGWKPKRWSLDEAAGALEYLDPDMPYDDWCQVIRGLKFAFGEDGYELARAWSEAAEEAWDPKEFERVWGEWDRTNDSGDSTTHATIIHMARESGWVMPSTTRKRFVVGDVPRELAVPVDTSDLSCARAVLDNLGWPQGALDALWRYSEERGIWEKIEQEEITRHIERLHNIEVGDKTLRLGHTKMRNIQSVIEMTEDWGKDWPNTSTGIAFKNGFLTPDGLVDHDPDHWCRHYINEDFDPGAVNHKWEAFLEETFSDKSDGGVQDRQCMQEFFGAALMGDAVSRRKVLFMHGPAYTGKSTILSIFAKLFHEDATSYLQPQRMTRPENNTPLFHSRINIVDDLSSMAFTETGPFKSAVSGGYIEGRYRYSHPIRFRPRCAWVMAGNRRPDTEDTTDGFFSRWIILDFTQVATEVDRSLPDKILNAGVGGIAAWAYRGYRRLVERGDGATYAMPLEQGSLVEGWAEESNSVIAWANEVLMPAPAEDLQHLAASTDLYKSYKAWMALFDPHGKILPMQKFVPELERMGWRRGRAADKRGFYCGLRAVTADGVKAG